MLKHGVSQMFNVIVGTDIGPIWLMALIQAKFLRVYPIAPNTTATEIPSVRITHSVCVEIYATIASLILSQVARSNSLLCNFQCTFDQLCNQLTHQAGMSFSHQLKNPYRLKNQDFKALHSLEIHTLWLQFKEQGPNGGDFIFSDIKWPLKWLIDVRFTLRVRCRFIENQSDFGLSQYFQRQITNNHPLNFSWRVNVFHALMTYPMISTTGSPNYHTHTPEITVSLESQFELLIIRLAPDMP